MNYTTLFYWLTVADNAKSFFWFFAVVFTIISIIATIVYIFNDYSDDRTMCRKWMMWSYPFMILFWAGIIFTPNKKDSLLIVAGGQTLNYLTTDSVTRQIPRELSTFVISELRNMAADANVQLDISNQKDKILEEAKKMSAEELISKMKSDTTLKSIILNN